jgi:hypothetical protein
VTCEQLTTFIADYIAGKLDVETTLAFEQHLQGCSDCIPFLNTYRQTIDAVRSLCDADIPPNCRIGSDDSSNKDAKFRVLRASRV